MARTASRARSAARSGRRTRRASAQNRRRAMQTAARPARVAERVVARDLGDTSRRVTDTTVQQLERAAATAEPVASALVRAGREYLICASRLSAESLAFAARRWGRDFAFARSLAHCKEWSDAVSLHREWSRQALSDYVENAAEMSRLTGLAALESWPSILRIAGGRR